MERRWKWQFLRSCQRLLEGGGNRSARLGMSYRWGLFTTSHIWAVVRCYSATFRRGVETKSCSSLKSDRDAAINCSQVFHPKTGAETFNVLPQTNPRGAGLKSWEGSWAVAPNRLAPQLLDRICALLLACVCSPVCKEWVERRGQIHWLMWVQPVIFFVFQVLFLSSRWSQTPAQDCLSWPFQIVITILPF